jgi:hypothetical protein
MKNSYDQYYIETDCEREEGHGDLRTKNFAFEKPDKNLEG